MSGFSSKICERCSLGRETGRSGWVCKCGKETREMVMKSDPACGSVLLRAVRMRCRDKGDKRESPLY